MQREDSVNMEQRVKSKTACEKTAYKFMNAFVRKHKTANGGWTV